MSTFCIVGGGGYVGYNLGQTLKSKGHNVRLYDLRYPTWLDLNGFEEVYKNDILDKSKLIEAFQDCDAVFHLAAYGMTGKESLNDALIHSINVTGSENVVEACFESGVSRLIYASTTDVVWCDSFLENGTEDSMPYLKPHNHVDNYGRTKTIAEKYVLAMNGRPLKKSSKTDRDNIFRACALRFHGIYGPREMRTTQRLLETIRDGLACVRFGQQGDKSIIQFVSGENCIQAMTRAFERLGPQHNHIAAGEAYFIMDKHPADTFDHWTPIYKHFGRSLPFMRVPFWFMYYLGYIMEIVCGFTNWEPLLTRKEVNHAAITHWFSIEKAQKQLGYDPQPPNYEAILEDYKTRVEPGYLKQQENSLFTKTFWPVITIILLLLYFVLL